MQPTKGFVFEVPATELQAAYKKHAAHHAERAAFYEGKLAEWNALPPILAAKAQSDTAPRLQLLAHLHEDRRGAFSQPFRGEQMAEMLGQLDGASMFQERIIRHRTSSDTFSFLATHLVGRRLDGRGNRADVVYHLTLDELQSAGLIGVVGEVVPGQIPGYCQLHVLSVGARANADGSALSSDSGSDPGVTPCYFCNADIPRVPHANNCKAAK